VDTCVIADSILLPEYCIAFPHRLCVKTLILEILSDQFGNKLELSKLLIVIIDAFLDKFDVPLILSEFFVLRLRCHQLFHENVGFDALFHQVLLVRLPYFSC
jgi:hypothetical protein